MSIHSNILNVNYVCRDLGSCLNNVRVLWLARSGVEDVDGISSMTGLKELYLAYNEIADISPISMVERLQILDLEGYVIIILLKVPRSNYSPYTALYIRWPLVDDQTNT